MHTEDEDTKPSRLAVAVNRLLRRMRADDDMLEVLNAFAALEPDAMEKVIPAQARRNPTIADAVAAVLDRRPGPACGLDRPEVTSIDTMVGGAAGPLQARVYRPFANTPMPVVLYFHGGGWVIGDKDAYDASACGLAHAAQAIVISVDYRLAPEHRFPAAWLDALAAYRWTLAHAPRFDGDPHRVALAGEGAGGNLAIATAIAARDEGLRLPMHVLAIYPVTQTDMNTESYLENAISLPLSRAMMGWFFEHATRNSSDLMDPRLQLIDAPLAGLPSVSLISAAIDPLRSDAAKMESALQKANVSVQHRRYDGVTHEFFGTAAVVAKARDAQRWAGERLHDAFDRVVTS
jgi:acetyl esterase/lipase